MYTSFSVLFVLIAIGKRIRFQKNCLHRKWNCSFFLGECVLVLPGQREAGCGNGEEKQWFQTF